MLEVASPSPLALQRSRPARIVKTDSTSDQAMASIPQRLTSFNQGRDSKRLAMKYTAMAKDPFAFFRGTCHLF